MTDNLLARQTYRNLLKTTMDATSIRNALGDIGNRIGFGAAKNDPSQLIKPQTQPSQGNTRCENALKPASQPQQPASIIPTTTKPPLTHVLTSSNSVSTESEPSSSSSSSSNPSNNSCIMLEITSDNDDVEILESEEEEADTEEVNDEEEDEDNEIIDIDSGDLGNPQLFADYVRSIYRYLVQLEQQNRVSPQFLHSKSITPKMRAVLIDWLMQVHSKFRLLQETMYLCVYLIDAYLERQDVSKMELQLVGVTGLLLACKYEEMYVPAIDDFVYMTDNTYTSAQIRAMEISMLKTLGFALGKPLPLHFLRRFSKAGQADPKHHIMAKYFMELSLHDIEFASMDPSYLAAASLCLSFKLLDGPKWNKNMEHHTEYKQESLIPGMAKLARLVLKTREPDYKYRAAYNKHASSKCMRISLSPELNSELIRELASISPNLS